MHVSIEMAILNAEASLRLEGMCPSAEVLRECRRVLEGDISHEQYIERLKEKYKGAEHVTV